MGNHTMQYSHSTFKLCQILPLFLYKISKIHLFYNEIYILSQFRSFQLPYFLHHRLLECRGMLNMYIWSRQNYKISKTGSSPSLLIFVSPTGASIYFPHCWCFQASSWLPRKPTHSLLGPHPLFLFVSLSLHSYLSLYIVFSLNPLIRSQFRIYSRFIHKLQLNVNN